MASMHIPMNLHRLQVERELRNNTLRLRQHYLRHPADTKKTLELMTDSISSFAALFRHALIALGEEPPSSKRDTIDRLGSVLGFDPSPFHTIFDIREGRKRERDVDVQATFGGYLDRVSKVTDEIDRRLATPPALNRRGSSRTAPTPISGGGRTIAPSSVGAGLSGRALPQVSLAANDIVPLQGTRRMVMKILLAVVGVVVALLILVALLVGGSYVSSKNEMVRKNEAIKQAWSQVDVVLQRRADLIPNLVATVKGYAKQEQTVFGDIANARAGLLNAKTPADKIAANGQLDGALGRLLAIVENYPDLKSNQNFLALQDELAGTENRIAVERRRYNEAIQDYNTYIGLFPNSIFAGWAGFQRNNDYFAASEGSRQAPKVDFSTPKQ